MPRSSQNAKKAYITVIKPRGKKQKTGSGSLVVFTPKKTRRGKTIYVEKDAASLFAFSDEEGKSSERKLSKTPSRSRTTVPASLEDTFRGEASFLDDQEPHIPRVTKVRLCMQCVIKV